MKRSNESGSALLLVMIAATLGVLVALTLTRMTSATGALSKAAQMDSDIEKIVRQVTGMLSDTKACPLAFRDSADVLVPVNVAALPTNIDRIYWGFNLTGARPIAKRSAAPTPGLAITTMQFANPRKIDATNWDITLQLQFEKIESVAPGPVVVYMPGASVLLKRFRMAVTLNGTAITACSPLGSRMALGPMSPIRSTIATTATTCGITGAEVTEKNGLCSALNPAALPNLPAYPPIYFPAVQGEAIFYGMLQGTTPVVTPPASIPGFGFLDVNGRVYGAGGRNPWAEYDLASADGPCTVMCIHKDAPVRFTRIAVASNASNSTKDTACKAAFGNSFLASTFNDFAQAGWSSNTGTTFSGAISTYPATIAGHAGTVTFGVDNTGNRVIDFSNAVANVPLACARLR